MKRIIISLAVLALLVLVISGSFFIIKANEFAILSRFGDPVSVIKEPGLYFKWIEPVERVIRIDKRLQVLDPPPSEYLSSDKKNLIVDGVAFWRVKEPEKFLRTVRDIAGAEMTLSDILMSNIGATLGAYSLDDLISPEPEKVKLELISKQITKQLYDDALERFGIEVLLADIKRLNFPTQNRKSVFSRMRAERERIATKYRAEGDEMAAEIQSDANRQRREIIAEAKRKAQETGAKAEAEALKIYGKAYSKDPKLYKFQRSLDTYKKIMKKNTTIVIPTDSELMKYLEKPPR